MSQPIRLHWIGLTLPISWQSDWAANNLNGENVESNKGIGGGMRGGSRLEAFLSRD